MEVSDQLERASLSSLLTAEGNGKASGSFAPNSSMMRAVPPRKVQLPRCTRGQARLHHGTFNPEKKSCPIVSILTKLVAKFEADSGDAGNLREIHRIWQRLSTSFVLVLRPRN